MKKNEEEPRGEREKRGASGSEGVFAPKKRVTRHVIPALPLLLFVAPGARARYPGPDSTRGYTEEYRTRAHPPTMGRATIYYSRASWHLTCRLAASLFRFSFCRPVDLFVSFSLSEHVVSVHVSSWVDRSPRLHSQLRNKVRVRGGANSSPWRS